MNGKTVLVAIFTLLACALIFQLFFRYAYKSNYQGVFYRQDRLTQEKCIAVRSSGKCL